MIKLKRFVYTNTIRNVRESNLDEQVSEFLTQVGGKFIDAKYQLTTTFEKNVNELVLVETLMLVYQTNDGDN